MSTDPSPSEFPLQAFTPEHHAQLLVLLGSADMVERVRIECSICMHADKHYGDDVRPDRKLVRDELRNLDRRLTKAMLELQSVSMAAADCVYGEAWRLEVKPPDVLASSRSQLSILRNCVKAAETDCTQEIARSKKGSKTPREHRLISMVLRAVPPTVIARSNDRLVRLMVVLYQAVGLPLTEDLTQSPRDHLATYFKVYGRDL